VELDGDAFRWKHLFTRQVSERDLSEIEAIVTLTLAFQADEFQVLLLLPGVFIASITMGPSAASALLTSLLLMGRSPRDSYTYIVPVCPNCHAVIHLGRRTRNTGEVKKLFEIMKKAQNV
jgi:hypothetical protein